MSESSEVLEGEIVEPRTGSALATTTQSTAAAVWTPSFAVGIEEAVARVDAKHQFFKRVMRSGDHYGVIPGTGAKPTLLKPGAELLLANMGLNAEFEDESAPILDVLGTEHNGEPFIWFRRRCKIYRQTGPHETERMLVGQASGSCNSWEKKYRYRNAERVCPQCGKPAIIKGKEEYGGGWVCFKKKEGCGAKFMDEDPAIVGQDAGKVANTEVFDLENTILKMADKRALVAATLIATGCSDIFTQDIEDSTGGDSWPAGASEPARTDAKPQAAPKAAQAAKEQPKRRTLEGDAKDFMERVEAAEARWNELRDGMTANERLRIVTAALGNPGAHPTRKDLPKLVEVAEKILAERDGIVPGTEDESDESLFNYATERLGGEPA